jgi:class 3 adenylate cyclase
MGFGTPCAWDGCRSLRSDRSPRRAPEQPIHIRIGLHAGETIRDADKFFGRTVIEAFRIADPEEILVSGYLREFDEDRGGFTFSDQRPVTLKSLSGEHATARVAWS